MFFGCNSSIPQNEKLSDIESMQLKTSFVDLKNKKVVGHNTDITGFETAIQNINFDFKKKKIFILGAGGVVPSIIYASVKMGSSEIMISNRTERKAVEIKNIFNNIG